MKHSTVNLISTILLIGNVLALLSVMFFLKGQSDMIRVLPAGIYIFAMSTFHLYIYLKLRPANDKDLSVSSLGAVQLRKSSLNKEKVVINGRKVYASTIYLKADSLDELVNKVKNEKAQLVAQLQNEEAVLLSGITRLKNKA